MTILSQAATFKQQLARLETQVTLQVLKQYNGILERLNTLLTEITAQIQTRKDAGEPVSAAWLYQQQRYQTLLSLVGQEMAQLAQSLNGAVTAAQRAAIAAAIAQAEGLVAVQAGQAIVDAGFVSLDVEAVTNMIAITMSEEMTRILSGFGEEAVQEVRDALVEAVALGESPRQAAQAVRDALGISLNRALTISRTEMLRASRMAVMDVMKANAKLVSGWVWLSAMDARTCAYCWANTGTHHPSTEHMATHPNCRCAQVPDVKSIDEILGHDLGHDTGGDRATNVIPLGVERFEELPAAEKRRVLGPAAYKLYVEGKLDLSDLVGTRFDRRFGRVGYTKSLRQLRREKVLTPA